MSKHYVLGYFCFSSAQVRNQEPTVEHDCFPSRYRAVCNTGHTTLAFAHCLLSYYFLLRVLSNGLEDERNALIYPERAKESKSMTKALTGLFPYFLM